MIVSRWGNSLAVRLPAKLVKQLGLEEGDALDVDVTDAGALRLKKTLSRQEALARLRSLKGSVPKDFKFDREEANER